MRVPVASEKIIKCKNKYQKYNFGNKSACSRSSSVWRWNPGVGRGGGTKQDVQGVKKTMNTIDHPRKDSDGLYKKGANGRKELISVEDCVRIDLREINDVPIPRYEHLAGEC